MTPLDSKLRSTLEKRIVEARVASEAAARVALSALAVHESRPYPSMSEDDRRLRNALRAKARVLKSKPELDLGPLVEELAYVRWHRFLFARFLAENDLLMHPDYEGVPVSMEDCAELAPEEGDVDGFATASRYAQAMLPAVFSTGDPLLSVRFFPEGRRAMISCMQGIPKPAFTSSDGLGWTYQFWQTNVKKEVNASGRKIGGHDLPAVTQLFTEDYMVDFLLHNSLGAWWAHRHPDSLLNATFTYLRRHGDTAPEDESSDEISGEVEIEGEGIVGTPAAGTFDGWPETAAEVTVLDPCCGSGHFVVAAAEMLARMRGEEEGLSPAEAADAVLRDNVFGLELDGRCAQIAAFSLALWAWKRGGYRRLPAPHIACSGTAAGGTPDEWAALAKGDHDLENTLRRLHRLFRDAPDLGSLIDPARVAEGKDFAKGGTAMLGVAPVEEVEELLDRALRRRRLTDRLADSPEPPGSDDDPDGDGAFAGAARGIARAATLMRGRYTLVATNVPYLARGKQADTLRDHLDTYYTSGKADLATAFVLRCRDYTAKGGSYALVTPQNWLFLGTYKKLRERLLKEQSWNLVARLGSGAFGTIGGEVVNVALLALTNTPAAGDHRMSGLDVSAQKTPPDKAETLRTAPASVLPQSGQLQNPDVRVSLENSDNTVLLSLLAYAHKGLTTSDDDRFRRGFWELSQVMPGWEFFQSTVSDTADFGGREGIVLYENGRGQMRKLASGHDRDRKRDLQGRGAWKKLGVTVSSMRDLPVTRYSGEKFDTNVSALVLRDSTFLPAIWSFCISEEFNREVRKIDQALKVTNASFVKIPFDLERWQKVAEERYPDGLPEPYSDDPTQWLFHGHPARASEGTALQVAVSRLLGYRWPAEAAGEAERMGISAEGRAWLSLAAREDLAAHTDSDGVICLPAVAGERPAAERLRAFLADAWEDAPDGAGWSQSVLERLLTGAGSGGKDLSTWLYSDYFKQHARLFHNRPFVWHITDGRRDGFSALVNYHKLDYGLLQRLTYTYLGDWIEGQRAASENGETGADIRLSAATDLQKRLVAILEGEPPYDIYIRWKKKSEQPIGWNPDINDGVRLNVRPFVEAGVLRSKFTVNWKKDRGKNPDGTERHNDLHLTRAEKEEARESAGTSLR